MANSVLQRKIKEKIDSLPVSDNIIVVLKGIPLSLVDSTSKSEDIETILENKLKYFSGLVEHRKYITYEEFLLLYSFVLEQYDAVYIVNNNLYINQYPIEAKFSEDTKQGLLNHFSESEDENDESYIGNIDEIIALFDGVRDVNGYLLGAYCDSRVEVSSKIINVNLFDSEKYKISSVTETDEEKLIITEEADFINLVRKVFKEPEEIYIQIANNYSGDQELLKAHIAILAQNWNDSTDIYEVKPQASSEGIHHRDGYTDILKEYWGYSSFRTFKVYDLDALGSGEKKVKEVSQEQIISDIVEEVEHCKEDSEISPQDVFVTAPTGAGKSVIFQVPAIYLAQKYDLLTIVISPLIGLMNDQVKNLENKKYTKAKTINSEISPIVKQEILEKVAADEYHILYMSPETLLARSDVEQLIGDRTIGMIVIDEAHIVTTWGKQFRPDYWYLGDHISKLRKNQINRKGQSFVIATFTATAIYKGFENMYQETINSLNMIGPITYLGYMKRDDINIVINKEKKAKEERKEYEKDKYDEIYDIIKQSALLKKKTLVYFPTVTLINSCYQYIESRMKSEGLNIRDIVARYYGPLPKDEKNENYNDFYNGKKLVMLATKAFGMGIDINDIEKIVHFAPTGNVCDYVQEIGRAARRSDLQGEAYYHYNSKDFKYINRLHGLSTISKYQLIEVIKKINELYRANRLKNMATAHTKKTNAMLVDAENFTYIFDNPISDEDENLNKVKTALLIIQKDFESNKGFSPITVRPIPLFAIGFFKIEPATQKLLNNRYIDSVQEINSEKHICKVNLQAIWNKSYKDKSFPQFKYLVYSKDKDLDFNKEYTLQSALWVKIEFKDDCEAVFRKISMIFKKIINDSAVKQEYKKEEDLVTALRDDCGFSKYKAQSIVDIFLASISLYSSSISSSISGRLFSSRDLKNNTTTYLFNNSMGSYFNWLEHGLRRMLADTHNGNYYVINNSGKEAKETNLLLGVFESWDLLSFEMNGGENSQLYIYINQVRHLDNIVNNPGAYKNRLLEKVAQRHLLSVKMLTYLYEGDFDSDKIWDILEDYFLGVIPERVKENCRREDPGIKFD